MRLLTHVSRPGRGHGRPVSSPSQVSLAMKLIAIFQMLLRAANGAKHTLGSLTAAHRFLLSSPSIQRNAEQKSCLSLDRVTKRYRGRQLTRLRETNPLA